MINNFKIIGISVETTNKNNQSLTDIENLWGEFYKKDITSRVFNKINNDIYAVYTDYESDYTGKYTMILGFAVDNIDDIPTDCIGREINIGKNQKFISKGKMPEAILKTWQEIWDNKELKRAYRADVSIHREKYHRGGDHSEIETYISIN